LSTAAEKPVVLQLLQARRKAPVIFWTIIFIALAEFFVIVVAPLILPDHFYLNLYLNKKSKASLTEFVAGQDQFLVYDNVVGWRNRPNTSYDEWQVDEYGSRSTHRFGYHKSKPTRIMFLGNSLINGGVHQNVGETISALVEDSVTESINFGTMLYSVDQMYLDYVNRLHQFESDIIVVGVQSDPGDGLVNQFIPFWKRSEANMPYLKPRFKYDNERLELVSVPELELYSRCLNESQLFDALAAADDYYADFDSYKRFGLLPLSSSLWNIARRSANFSHLLDEEADYQDLVIAILELLRQESEANGAHLVVLMFPDQEKAFPGGLRSLLPDKYGNLVSSLRQSGFEVVDARDAIRRSTLAPWQLYFEDRRHFLKAGNKAIAGALKERVAAILEARNTRF